MPTTGIGLVAERGLLARAWTFVTRTWSPQKPSEGKARIIGHYHGRSMNKRGKLIVIINATMLGIKFANELLSCADLVIE